MPGCLPRKRQGVFERALSKADAVEAKKVQEYSFGLVELKVLYNDT